tara:strand:- start:123 stop:782 length:660 start_codon:yes stop_codon:yes gene_type:complete
MIRIPLLAAASALILAACASAPETAKVPGGIDAEAASTAPDSAFELAMQTVENLVDAGNTQAAVDRLTQLLGSPTLSKEEMAEALFRRGEIRFGPGGYDAVGAVEDFEEIVDSYSDTEWYTAAVPMLDSARGKVTTLETQLAQPETSKMQKFNFLMELGMHEDAIDLMIANDLQPSNEALIAMYDIGYLCEGDELTGRTYEAVELDGTTRELRFCDFGK